MPLFFSLKLWLFLTFYPSIWMTRITSQVLYINIHTHLHTHKYTIYHNFFGDYFELTDKHGLFSSTNMLFFHIFRTGLCSWTNSIILSIKILPSVAENIRIMIRVFLKLHCISNWRFSSIRKLLIFTILIWNWKIC